MLDLLLSFCVLSMAVSVIYMTKAVHNLVRAQMGLQAHLNVMLQQMDKMASPPYIVERGFSSVPHCEVCSKFPVPSACGKTNCPYASP